jgi:predicted amidohydrolase YtcJ
VSPVFRAGAERVTGGKWIAVVSECETARTLWRGKRRHATGDDAVSEALDWIDSMASEGTVV